jgi:predicted nucleotidyltransferase
MNNRIEIAKEFAKKINSKYVKQVILFGSVARGDDDEDSDIDILIISSDNKKIEQKVKDEIFNILLSKDQLISAHVISEKKKFNETKNFSFLSNVLSEGVPIG